MANNRNKIVQFRLNDEEFLKFGAVAKMKGISKSDLARESIDFYLDTVNKDNRDNSKHKPFIFDIAKAMRLLLESDKFHKEELKREVARLLWTIDQ